MALAVLTLLLLSAFAAAGGDNSSYIIVVDCGSSGYDDLCPLRA